MTPSADRTSTIPLNSETFLMTNMIPQAPVNNQQTWNNMEQDLRSLVGAGNELYIISGGAGTGGVGNNGPANTIAGGQGDGAELDVEGGHRAAGGHERCVTRDGLDEDYRGHRAEPQRREQRLALVPGERGRGRSIDGLRLLLERRGLGREHNRGGVDSAVANPAMKAGATSKGVSITRLR
jgi:hypothetical protein